MGLLSRYLEEDSAETLGYTVPDVEKLEAMFPLLPAQQAKPRGSQRRHSRSRENNDSFDSRRNSLSSNPPSHRRASVTSQGGDSNTSKGSLMSRSNRRHATAERQAKETAKAKEKEPPPG